MAISGPSRPTPEAETLVRHWQRVGLLNPSVIKPAIGTLAPGPVIRKLGHRNDDNRDMLERVLTSSMGHQQTAQSSPTRS